MKGKKGISPLIATVLIIGFTIVLAALVITWGTGLFKRTVSETETLSQFNLLCTTGVDYEGTAKEKAAGGVEYITTLSNKKDKEISGFYFIARKKDGSKANTFTTDYERIQASLAKVGVAPEISQTDSSGGVLSAFSTKSYTLTTVGDSGLQVVEVRPIVAIDTGEKKVCEQSQIIVIKSA